ncbi:MAG: OadG family protein [Eubacteriales bacterium]|nr:OadG family protein [Christensenellaceae bacterium]MDY2751031.1 OadG family protein [Eubacteriales bacterium]MDY6078845.1 OadG family protein [Eubacteriales bacterium]
MFVSSLASDLGERMAIGGKLTLIGVLMVFILLGVLVVILQIIDYISRKTANKPKKEKKKLWNLLNIKKTDKTVETTDTVEAGRNEPAVADFDADGETVAAITAAVMAMLSAENDGSDVKFIVRKIKKLNYRR